MSVKLGWLANKPRGCHSDGVLLLEPPELMGCAGARERNAGTGLCEPGWGQIDVTCGSSEGLISCCWHIC